MARKSNAPRNAEWERVFKSNYMTAAFSYFQWLGVADDLLESANLVEIQVRRVFRRFRAHARDRSIQLLPDGVIGVHFMLMSYAVENLFKAALVRERAIRYTREFESKMQFPQELRTHDLVRLARETGFAVDLQREDLLRRLRRSAEWRGRYPAPLAYSDMAGMETFRNGSAYSVSHFGGKDSNRLKALVQDIRNELNLKSLRIPR